MLGWLTRWLPAKKKSRRAPTASRRRSPLGRLEVLETRENPAVNTWLNYSTVYSNPANWSDGVPTSDDILVFTPRLVPNAATLENPNPPPTPVSTGTTFPTSGADSFAGIRYLNGYSGTTLFPVDITFGEYTQTCGNTSQVADTVVSVTGDFDWTGGKVNTSSNEATYKLIGVTTGTMGAYGSTVETGSTIILEKYGSIGTLLEHAGVVQFNNEADLDIYSACQLIPKFRNPLIDLMAELKSGRVEDPEKNLVTVYIGGEYPTEGGVKTGMGLVADGGEIIVAKGSKSTGKLIANGRTGALADSPSVEVKGGKLRIRGGETLEALHGVLLGPLPFPTATGPTLETLTRPIEEGDTTATIDGKLTILSGSIRLGVAYGGELPRYSKLHVVKNVDFQAGIFYPSVKGSDVTLRDQITTDEKLKFGTSATVLPVVEGTATSGTSWDVFDAVNGVDGTTLPGTDPLWEIVTALYGVDGKRLGVRKH